LFFSFTVFLHRTNCPKVTSSSILLSDEENKIWEQAEAIQDNNTELVEAILSRYGFTDEYRISKATLQRYGIRIYQDQLVAPLYDHNRSLVNVIFLDPSLHSKISASFGLNILSARNAEIILVDSIWDALCVYQTTGKVAITIPNTKFSIRVR